MAEPRLAALQPPTVVEVVGTVAADIVRAAEPGVAVAVIDAALVVCAKGASGGMMTQKEGKKVERSFSLPLQMDCLGGRPGRASRGRCRSHSATASDVVAASGIKAQAGTARTTAPGRRRHAKLQTDRRRAPRTLR